VNRLERLYHIHETLRDARHPVPLRRLVEAMEVTEGAARKDIRYLRDHFRAPIKYDTHLNGYYYDPEADAFELPKKGTAVVLCQYKFKGALGAGISCFFW
jgi:predicted DNA-binding transcriptional regulator YafY